MSTATPVEVLLPVAEVPWISILPGIDFRLLFTSGETGRWTVLFRCQPGSSFPSHRHYGAGEYFVVKGLMEYRTGSATAGTYGYEPLGSLHELTRFPEYTELLFTNHGPVAFLNEDGSVSSMLDNTTFEQLVSQSQAA
jgi:anti-sigma factor ChrR (cupin superfamily)